MTLLRRWTSWTILFALATATTAYSTLGQEGPVLQRKVPDRKDLAERFARVLPNISDANWVGSLPEKSTEAEVGRFGSVVRRVPEDVQSIFTSEVELGPIFLVSMDVNCDTFSDLAMSTERGLRISEPLFRRVVSASTDIRIKADYLSKQRSSEVKVTVRTLTPGTTTVENGCFVYYAPAYDDRPSTRCRFGPVSSPSVDKMPPGTFAIWSVREGKEGRRDRITLVAGTTEKDFDIESPEK